MEYCSAWGLQGGGGGGLQRAGRGPGGLWGADGGLGGWEGYGVMSVLLRGLVGGRGGGGLEGCNKIRHETAGDTHVSKIGSAYTHLSWRMSISCVQASRDSMFPYAVSIIRHISDWVVSQH